MRATQTGTGKGQIIGIASIDFYAARDRRINGCTVHWDSDPAFVPLLPALAFDEYLPNLRLIHVSTDAGEGVIVGEDAQRMLLGEFEDWLADARTHLSREGELPLYDVVPLVDEHEPPGDVAAQTDFTVRINVKKERLWGESKHTPGHAHGQLGHPSLDADDGLFGFVSSAKKNRRPSMPWSAPFFPSAGRAPISPSAAGVFVMRRASYGASTQRSNFSPSRNYSRASGTACPQEART